MLFSDFILCLCVDCIGCYNALQAALLVVYCDSVCLCLIVLTWVILCVLWYCICSGLAGL